MDFVFIIGISRTASKTYQSFINKHSEIDIVNELHYITPGWLKTDFITYSEKLFSNIFSQYNVEYLVDTFYKGIYKGAFWSINNNINEINYNITDIKKNILIDKIRNSNITYKNLLELLLEQHAISIGKKIGGAKFPVNISCVPTLLKWFPDAKYLHLTRDPRAVYPSMVKMDLRSRNKISKAAEYKYNIFRFFYLIHQYKWSNKIHNFLNGNQNYFLSRFEDLIIDPTNQLSNICDFLDITFNEEMLNVEVKDTSFGISESRKGFNMKAVNRWENTISPITAKLIKNSLKKEMYNLGYHNT